MKICKDCKVKVRDDIPCCPLCGAMLAGEIPVHGVSTGYPKPAYNRGGFNLVRRILAFISIMACVGCGAINYFTYNGYLWSIICITVIIYCWFAVSNAIRKGKSLAGKVLVQTICACLLSLLIEYEAVQTVFWSINYVLPSILCGSIITITLLLIFNRTNRAGYIMYQIVITVFGFIPFVLYFLGYVSVWYFSFTASFLALGALLGTIIFGDKMVKSEFRRRFHI